MTRARPRAFAARPALGAFSGLSTASAALWLLALAHTAEASATPATLRGEEGVAPAAATVTTLEWGAPQAGQGDAVEAAAPAAPELSSQGAEAQGETLGAPDGGSLSGFLDVRTRSRFAEDHDADDHDLYAVLGADFVTAGAQPWKVHVLLRGSLGLDRQDPDSVFYGVQDTYTNAAEGRIYHLYVDTPFAGDDLRLARVGRMLIFETPTTAYFDGIQLETAPRGIVEFVVGAYGGNSVHLFEDWTSEEWMGGVYASFRPWIDGRVRVDWMHLGDDPYYGEGDDDLVAFTLEHAFSADLHVKGDYTLLDGEGRDFSAEGTWVLPSQELTVRASYFRQLEQHADLTYELNPYFNQLATYFPYDQSRLSVSKVFGDTLELFGGLDLRRVEDAADIGRFNRDFDRYYVTAALPELLPLDTTLSATGEWWDSDQNDVTSWGLDLTSQLDDDTTASLGSYYSLYKYYFDVGDEREDVRTYYVEIKNDYSESVRLRARYEYEDEPIDTFHSLRLGVTWRF
ncbi:MAG: hypothetical protein H6828_13595 [Planctomycetes bacterium]|nr:hypothetical protein [Planctomycetota bacterium]